MKKKIARRPLVLAAETIRTIGASAMKDRIEGAGRSSTVGMQSCCGGCNYTADPNQCTA